jgi:arginine exporter protein ArgO
VLETALAGAVAGFAIAAAAAGAASADGAYASVAALAGAGVSTLIGPLMAPLRLSGGVVLVGIGVYGLVTAWRSREHVAAQHVPVHRPHGRTYLALLGLTLLNPATVIYFAALTVGLPFLGDVSERLAFAGGAFVASLSWQSLLALFGALLGRGAGHRLRLPTVLLGNLIVIAFGLVVLAGTVTHPAAS